MDSMVIDLSVKDIGILRITVLREGGTLIVVGSDDLAPGIRKLVFKVAEDAFKKRDAAVQPINQADVLHAFRKG
jgi:hypothetical protein